MASRIHVTEDREESHRFLAEYLEGHPGSPAECRVLVQETPEPVLYEVWDGRQDPNYRDPEVDVKAGKEGLLLKLSDSDVEAVAAAVAAKLAKEA